MLKTLLKKQMAEIFRNYFYDPKKNKMRSKGATIAYIALYALLMVGFLGGIFALMAVGLCGPLVEGGMDWLYYLLMGLIAVFLGTFGGVFSTYSSLYLSKDNDLLLSMPIPVRCVMASRLLGVYLLGLMYAAVVIVPGVIVYWLTAPVTAGTIVGGVLMVLIVSVIVMVLSCLLGWVVARISLKLKNKSFITVILSLLFLAAYYFVYYKAQALITLLVVVALLYTLLSALAALALGLKMPNLTWTNETTPIKQSGCVMLSLFANWFYAIALGGLYFLCGNVLSAAAYLAIFAVVTAAGSALLLRWVKKQGARIFAAL